MEHTDVLVCIRQNRTRLHTTYRHSNTSHTHFQNGFLVRFDKVRCLRYEVAEELGALFLVAADATVLQLRQDLDQHLSERGHHEGGVEVTKATNGGK